MELIFKSRWALGASALLLVIPSVTAQLSPIEQLGKSIFFDEQLSINQNQSCATCHGEEVGFTGPSEFFNAAGAVYEGSILMRFGDRKPPSAAYATESPIFHVDKKGLFVGGNFWDGRATGEKLGNPAADQAQGPFLNPVEQALPDSACVVHRVCNPLVHGSYPIDFDDVWEAESCDISWPDDVNAACATDGSMVALSPEDRAKSDIAYDNIALSIAAYEASLEVNAFSSKFDVARPELTKQEKSGLALFKGKGKCRLCHSINGKMPLLTDFTFDNLGLPQNPDNPAGVALGFVDPGLGGFLKKAGYPEEVYEEEWGKHKVPTLRNVDKRPYKGFIKAFGHNGYFKTLKGIVHFYNTRDVKPGCPGLYTEEQAIEGDCWPAPEVPENVNQDELGDLGLSDEEEDALVAFLKTLSDGYAPVE